jgi:hypothetical protein
MWARYKKTFVAIQTAIALVTCAVFLATGRRIPEAAVFFTAMQVGSVLGALWGVRLHARVQLSQ